MRRAVLWDVGGTLVGRIRSVEAGRARALREVGVDPGRVSPAAIARAETHYHDVEPRWRTLADERLGWRQVAERMLADSLDAQDAGDDRAAALASRFADYFDAYAPTADVRALMDELAGRGLVQAVVSNWPPSLRRFLRHHQLDRHLSAIAGSGEAGISKPHPGLFERALEQLALPAAAAIYVGDNPVNDIAPARALGLEAVHFDPWRRCREAEVRTAPELRRRLLSLIRA